MRVVFFFLALISCGQLQAQQFLKSRNFIEYQKATKDFKAKDWEKEATFAARLLRAGERNLYEEREFNTFSYSGGIDYDSTKSVDPYQLDITALKQTLEKYLKGLSFYVAPVNGKRLVKLNDPQMFMENIPSKLMLQRIKLSLDTAMLNGTPLKKIGDNEIDSIYMSTPMLFPLGMDSVNIPFRTGDTSIKGLSLKIISGSDRDIELKMPYDLFYDYLAAFAIAENGQVSKPGFIRWTTSLKLKPEAASRFRPFVEALNNSATGKTSTLNSETYSVFQRYVALTEAISQKKAAARDAKSAPGALFNSFADILMRDECTLALTFEIPAVYLKLYLVSNREKRKFGYWLQSEDLETFLKNSKNK